MNDWFVENPTVGSHASLAEAISWSACRMLSSVRRMSVVLAVAQLMQSSNVHTEGICIVGAATTISADNSVGLLSCALPINGESNAGNIRRGYVEVTFIKLCRFQIYINPENFFKR